MEYGFQQLRGNKENIDNLIINQDIYEGQLLISKDEKSIYALVDGVIQKLSEIYIGETEPTGPERGKVFFDTANKTVKIHNAALDTYESIAGGSGDVITQDTQNGFIKVNGVSLKVYDDTLKANKSTTDNHETRIGTLENRAIGDKVADSLVNGNIKVNNLELNVYDDTSLQTALSGKQPIGNYALKSTTDNHETRITTLENTPAVSGGDSIADSTINGNILKNGTTEIKVYDDTAILNAISGKQASGDYATNTALTTGLAGKENSFTKKTGFNKDYYTGTGAGNSDTVARGNHNHDTSYAAKSSEHTHSNKTVLDGLTDTAGQLKYNGNAIGGNNDYKGKFANIGAMPTGSSLGDTAMDLSQFKICVYRTSNINNLVSPMTSDNSAGQVSTASSVNSVQFSSWHAFNGSVLDAYDTWASLNVPSVGSPEWIALDFGASKSVSGASLVSRNDSSARTYDPSNFKWQYSSDNVNFSDAMTITGETFSGAGEQKDYTFTQPITARYWRLLITATAGNIYAAVGEIKLNGSTNAWQVM